VTETSTPPAERQKLDDVLIAMDVVDTLRHRDETLVRELDIEGREERLIQRLREIYTAQGIVVSDAALREGVRALEEKRFFYAVPKRTLAVQLAEVYIARDKWLAPLIGAVAAIGIGMAGWQFGIAQPARAKAAATRIELTQTLPAALKALSNEIITGTDDAAAERLAQLYLSEGLAAAAAGKQRDAQRAEDALLILKGDLSAVYDVRVVYGEDHERSGMFRIPNDAPLTRNYYLIVQAVDPAGRILEVPVTSEEDGAVRRASVWGQRVTETDFNRVATDKGDDQIIQNNVIGAKSRGRLRPVYSVETPGGAILEW
jgi:uncharacterized protein (DUF2164 family)